MGQESSTLEKTKNILFYIINMKKNQFNVNENYKQITKNKDVELESSYQEFELFSTFQNIFKNKKADKIRNIEGAFVHFLIFGLASYLSIDIKNKMNKKKLKNKYSI